jgi:hypothetical protein
VIGVVSPDNRLFRQNSTSFVTIICVVSLPNLTRQLSRGMLFRRLEEIQQIVDVYSHMFNELGEGGITSPPVYGG